VVRDEAAPGHGAVVAGSLLRAPADVLGASLRIEQSEVDSVLATASDGLLGNPALLLDLMDQAYAAFLGERSRREASTVCPCGACAAISDIGLSFAVHHGEWTRSGAGGRPSCKGADVAIVRRLSTSFSEAHGRAVISAAARERIGVPIRPEGADPLPSAVDEVAGEGSIALDLAASARVEGVSRPLEPRDTMASLETLLPIPPVQAWDWLTAPDKRTLWEDVDTIASNPRPDGRAGVGTSFHSEQGRYVDEVYEVVDWQPFRRWSWDLHRRGLTVRSTVELSLAEGGTRVTSRFGVAPGTGTVQRMRVRREVERRIAVPREKALARLRQLLEIEQTEARRRRV
jgi:hypothetical protein